MFLTKDVVHSGACHLTPVKTINQINTRNFKKIIAENKVKAGVAGGIETVVKAINAHANKSDLCTQGCGSLWVMTTNNGK